MKILVDENIPKMTVSFLIEKGHDVKDIRGSELEGIPDNHLWNLLRSEGRMLITTDKGFIQYRNEQHDGILIVRLKQPNRLKIHNHTIKAMTQFTKALLINNLV